MTTSITGSALDICSNRLIVGGDWQSVADLTARVRQTHAVHWSGEESRRVRQALADHNEKAVSCAAEQMEDALGLHPVDPDVAAADVFEDCIDYERGRFNLGACLPVPAKVARWGKSFGRIWKVANWGTEAIVGESTLAVCHFGSHKGRARYSVATVSNPPVGAIRHLSLTHPDLWLRHTWMTAHGRCGGSLWINGRQMMSVTSRAGSQEPIEAVHERMADSLRTKVL